MTRSAAGAAITSGAAIAASARHKPLPPRPNAFAVVSRVSDHVDTGRRGRLRRWTGTGVGAAGGPVARGTLKSATQLPAEHADRASTVDHVEQWINGTVSERHDLTD